MWGRVERGTGAADRTPGPSTRGKAKVSISRSPEGPLMLQLGSVFWHSPSWTLNRVLCRAMGLLNKRGRRNFSKTSARHRGRSWPAVGLSEGRAASPLKPQGSHVSAARQTRCPAGTALGAEPGQPRAVVLLEPVRDLLGMKRNT